MDELHRKLAEVLKESLENPGVDENGVLLKPSPAMLNVARQFLKDNGVEAQVKTSSPLDHLANLPVFDPADLPHLQ
jgi:hypothetical protein